MGERKGQNKYYPPDFDPSKHFSLNSYHGVHALRERGKKAHEGILTIRFEMPFNCWCLSCDSPIGMGVRYNSEKTKTGYFYSTPIFQFKMKCHLCKGEIVIQTDPEHFQYNIISGLRRREQRYTAEDTGLPELSNSNMKKKLASDPMFHLEHAVKDEEVIKSEKPALTEIYVSNLAREDDFGLNQLARKRFRIEKKLKLAEQNKLDSLTEKMSLKGSDLILLPQSESDGRIAKSLLRNASIDVSNEAVERRKRRLKENMKRKIMKRESKYLPFSDKKTEIKNELLSRKKTLTMGESADDRLSKSLVSNDYDTSDDN